MNFNYITNRYFEKKLSFVDLKYKTITTGRTKHIFYQILYFVCTILHKTFTGSSKRFRIAENTL